MIAYLRGKPAAAGNDWVIIDVGGIGYKVFVPVPVISALTDSNSEVTVFTYMHVREDAIQLFGCLTETDLRIFEHLIQVSGVGPRVALAVLSSMTVSAFIQAVINEEVQKLTGIPGVGKKTAQRIIIELKDKLGKMETGNSPVPAGTPPGPPDSAADALQALIALGYNPTEAKRALGRIDNTSLGLEEVVRFALKELARL